MLFFTINIFIYFLAVQFQRRENRLSLKGVVISEKFRRFGIVSIIACCVLMGIYSNICGQVPYSSDRGNYALRFLDDIYLPGVKRASLGLYWIEVVLHAFTYNPKALFFAISALYVFFSLVAYNFYPEVKPRALLYAGLSNYFIFSFYLLKQAPAIALIAISIAAFLKKKRSLWLLTLSLAICFHESALIMIPVFLILTGAKKQWVRIAQYIALIVCLVAFREITQIISLILGQWIPALGFQLGDYFENTGSNADNILTVFKGTPYYLITFYAVLKRTAFKDRILHYDSYLMMSFFVSIITIMSAYMYWMWRFSSYCYFPMFIFASLLYREAYGRKDRGVVGWMLSISFFLFTIRVISQYYFLYGGI